MTGMWCNSRNSRDKVDWFFDFLTITGAARFSNKVKNNVRTNEAGNFLKFTNSQPQRKFYRYVSKLSETILIRYIRYVCVCRKFWKFHFATTECATLLSWPIFSALMF